MPEIIQVQSIRVTFIWADTILDLLSDQPPETMLRAFLSRRSEYATAFEAAQVPGVNLRLPWSQEGRSFFWLYYTDRRSLADLSGDQAWKTLIPLRHTVPRVVEIPSLATHPILEAFYYPFGLALLVSVRLRGNFVLSKAVDQTLGIYRGRVFQTSGEDETTENISLDMLGERFLAQLSQEAYGTVRSGAQTIKPFSVVTVVQGSGVDPSVSVEECGEIHRAINALSTWSATWRYDQLDKLDEASIPLRRAPPGHVLYGARRGRAVWFPASFMPQQKPIHTLSCYHRNLVFLSMQVESLGHFLRGTTNLIETGMPLSDAHEQCARHTAGILGRLYAGHHSTYRSWSAYHHIAQNRWETVVNQVREKLNMSSLSCLPE